MGIKWNYQYNIVLVFLIFLHGTENMPMLNIIILTLGVFFFNQVVAFKTKVFFILSTNYGSR